MVAIGVRGAYDGMMLPLLRSRLVSTRDHVAAAAIVARAAVMDREDNGEVRLWRGFRALLQGDQAAAKDLPVAELARLARVSETVVLAASQAPALAGVLRGAVRWARQVDALLGFGAERASEALGPLAGVRVALLKGSATGVLCWEEPALRQRRDLDLLVRPEDFTAVRAALWNAGWRDSPDPEPGGPPFSGRTFGMRLKVGGAYVGLDLHRDLVKPAWCGLQGAVFREAFLDGAIGGLAPLPVTNHLHTLLHTVAHVVHAGFQLSIKAFVDIVRLLPRLDDTEIVAAATRWQMRTATWACLMVASRWFDIQRPRLLEGLGVGDVKSRVLMRVLAGDGVSAERVPSPKWTAVHGFPVLLSDE